MAPVRRVTSGRGVTSLVRETRQERIARDKRERAAAELAAALEANRRHVAVTGKPMPQGGKHRRKGKGA